ncbi:MAG: hypothetical protein OXC68_01195 [Aestuariivita sp.]|nr:hypothetical protein [Aestuariivita sp.]
MREFNDVLCKLGFDPDVVRLHRHRKESLTVWKRVGQSALVIGFMLAAVSVSADEMSAEDYFALWNKCRPISLVVGLDDKDHAIDNFTEDEIITTVRSRLRGARLYTSENFPNYLSVSLIIFMKLFNFS